jgi:hypothetical protein
MKIDEKHIAAKTTASASLFLTSAGITAQSQLTTSIAAVCSPTDETVMSDLFGERATFLIAILFKGTATMRLS